MKKILFLLGGLLFHFHPTHSQIIQNGDFSINSGNITHKYLCDNIIWSAPTFADYTVPNWFRTHGTPHFPCAIPPGPGCANINDIFLIGYAYKGEGIAGGYPFQAGVTYEIHVGVRALSSPSKIRMVATANLQRLLDACPSYICTGESLMTDPPPVPNPVPTTVAWQELSVPSFSVGDNAFLYTPSNAYNWIMLFPHDDGHCYQNEITLTYIWITPQCKGDKYYPANNSMAPENPIPLGTNTYYDNVYIGTSYRTFPNLSGIETISMYGTTIVEAKKQITIKDNFVASYPSHGGYFLLQINNNCGYEVPYDHIPAGKSTDSVDKSPVVKDYALSTGKPLLIDKLSSKLYPNPANFEATLELSLPSISMVNIKLSDIRGGVLMDIAKETKSAGTHRFMFKIGDLPNGIYNLNIETDMGKIVERLTVVR